MRARYDSLAAVLAMSLILVSACNNVTDAGITDEARAPDASKIAAPASETETLIKAAPFRIVMLGDSLTAGFGLSQADALPEQVERLLIADGERVELVNAGVSGDTSAGGLARYDWSVASADPDMLVLALGANDYLSGMDPAQTKANLSAIVERAAADDLEILLVSLSARSSAQNDPRAAAFADIYPELAETYGVRLYEGLVDPIFDQPDYLMADGLHPTAEGIGVIAHPLAETLSEFLARE
ncbi:MAG: arylesterase [Pseudomonadota bacterium]